MGKLNSKNTENSHYDIFISYRTKNSSLVKEIYKILIELKYKVFFSEVELIKKGNPNYKKEIERVLKNSSILVIFLGNKKDIRTKWIKHEYRYFWESHLDPLIIPIVNGFETSLLPTELRMNDALDFSKENFTSDLITFCKPKNELRFGQYEKKEVFISRNFNEFADIPLNLLSYCGFYRYSIEGIILNYDLGQECFEIFENNVQNALLNHFQRRNWVFINSLEIEKLENIEFNHGKNELLGIIAPIFLKKNNYLTDHIIRSVINFQEFISKQFDSFKPIVLINIIGKSAPDFAMKLRKDMKFIDSFEGFSPDGYKAKFGNPIGRWECVVALREYFGGTMNAIDHIKDNRDDYNGDFLAKIIELACNQTKDGNSFEHSFLANINDHSLLVALQCGYKFRTPFKELVNCLVRKGISDGMLGLTVLCMEPEQIDFEVVASWDLNKRKFIGLLTAEEQANAGNVRQCFDQRNYFSSLYDDIIYH